MKATRPVLLVQVHSGGRSSDLVLAADSHAHELAPAIANHLHETGGSTGDRWELRRDDGARLRDHVRLGDLDIRDGDRLHLHPVDGGGGDLPQPVMSPADLEFVGHR
jgi:hypothetical protein